MPATNYAPGIIMISTKHVALMRADGAGGDKSSFATDDEKTVFHECLGNTILGKILELANVH